jgi:hypothetical protein
MTDLENLQQEITIQTDIAEGLKARMAKQDNGYQHLKLACVTRTLERLRSALQRRESAS